MGLSASQARLLSLTARMHDIEYKAQNLEAQKLQMANESRQVYQEYENALNKQKVQFKQIGADTGRLSSAEPNMQNIPSHATDIRHMFRATAASSKVLDCDYDDTTNSISIELPKIYYVHTPEGEKKVEDLQIGDSVKLQNDEKEIYKNVKSVENSSKDPSLYNVIF